MTNLPQTFPLSGRPTLHRLAGLAGSMLLGLAAVALASPSYAQATPPAEPTKQAAPSATPATSGADGFDPDFFEVPVRFANPEEIAAILRISLGLKTAIGSVSTGSVVISGVDQAQAGFIQAKVELLDMRAGKLAEQRMVEAKAREREAQARQIEAEKARQEELAKNALVIDFPGGTVGEYLDLVRKASGSDNIVIGTDSVKSLRMPAVRLKRVTSAAASLLLRSLRFTSDGNEVSLDVDFLPGDPNGVGIGAETVMVVDYQAGTAIRGGASPVRVEVFDLSAYKRHEPKMLEDLIDAVKLAASLQGSTPDFNLALHEGTGLLFVRGSEDDIEIVARTLQTFDHTRGVPGPKE